MVFSCFFLFDGNQAGFRETRSVLCVMPSNLKDVLGYPAGEFIGEVIEKSQVGSSLFPEGLAKSCERRGPLLRY